MKSTLTTRFNHTFSKHKRDAAKRNIEFTVSNEYLLCLYLEQCGKCYFSGLNIEFSTRDTRPKRTASIDRIDSTKGYIEGNVHWVHKVVNMMKQKLSSEEFVKWCKIIAKHNEAT